MAVYRSSRGKQVDMGALLQGNELTPALGNMNVNARGDEILSDGTITKTRDQVMKEYHRLNATIPSDDAIPESAEAAMAIQSDIVEDNWEDWDAKTEAAEEDPEPSVSTGTNVAQMVAGRSTEETEPTGSLASSVAGSKSVTETVDTTGFEETAADEGVKRI
jgi:hypothetical protein